MIKNSQGYKLETRACPVCGKDFLCPRTKPLEKACSTACGYAKQRQDRQPKTEAESVTDAYRGDDREIVIVKTRIKTLAQLVAACEIDLDTWEVVSFIVNKWEVGAVLGKADEKKITVEPLFQVKAVLRRKLVLLAVRSEIDSLKADAKKFAPRSPAVRHPATLSGNMLEINIPDLHLGKLAWGPETGWENYDVKIAEQVNDEALDSLIARTSCYKFDEVLYVVGNDLLNADNQNLTTTRGTQVSSDGRHQKTFLTARRMTVRSIEKLRHVARKVVVKLIPGNHDQNTNFYLGDSLECWFDKTPGVVIDNAPCSRKYHEFGSCMLMLTHGDKGKRADYPLLMATEEPEMFGRTKFREAHTGHYHTTKTEEFHGVRVRILSALCPPDSWHAENAMVANLRSAEAYVWSQSEGLIGIAVHTAQCHSTDF